MIRFVLTTAFLALASLTVSAQETPELDSVLVRYRFQPGEKVTYRVIAFDSIVIYDRPWRTLARERAELVTYRCDSVLPGDSGYIMTVTTTEYAATEYLDTLPPVSRTSHPWVGRAIRFQMSPSGRRKYLFTEGEASNAPGGPFSPVPLPDLGEPANTFIGSSGGFEDAPWLLETVFPPITWRGTSFRIVRERLDTLGEKTLHLGMSQVGNAYHQTEGEGKPMTRTIYNGGSELYYSPSLGYIVGGIHDMIAKFTLERPDGQKVDGRHILSMSYERVGEDGMPIPKKKSKAKSRR